MQVTGCVGALEHGFIFVVLGSRASFAGDAPLGNCAWCGACNEGYHCRGGSVGAGLGRWLVVGFVSAVAVVLGSVARDAALRGRARCEGCNDGYYCRGGIVDGGCFLQHA